MRKKICDLEVSLRVLMQDHFHPNRAVSNQYLINKGEEIWSGGYNINRIEVRNDEIRLMEKSNQWVVKKTTDPNFTFTGTLFSKN